MLKNIVLFLFLVNTQIGYLCAFIKCSMAYELRKCEPRQKKHDDKSTDCNDKCIGKPQLHAISTFVANLTYSLNAGMAELQPGTCL